MAMIMGKSIKCGILMLALSAWSCSKEKEVPFPTPVSKATSGISQDKKVIAQNEVVSFTNLSNNAVRFEWDFGNGEYSTDRDASTSYISPGKYKVILKSYDANNIPSISYAQVKVGQMVISKYQLNRFSTLKANGQPWDSDGTGPDVRLSLFKISRPLPGLGIRIADELDLSKLPVSVLRPHYNAIDDDFTYYVMDDQDWQFTLEDFDYQPNGYSTRETVGTWVVKPTKQFTVNHETGTGSFILSNNEAEIEITCSLE